MNKKFWLAIGSLLVIYLGLALFYDPPKWEGLFKKPATIKIVGDRHSLLYLPQYIALWKKFFVEEKLIVEATTVASENVLLHELKSGRGDILLTGLEQGIYAQAEQREKLVAFSALTKREHTFLVARKQDRPFEWANLKNKTVITGPPGSRETVVFKGILWKQGVAPNREVTLFTNIPASLQIGAFKSGTGDYILLAEPEATYAEKSGLGKVVASLGKEAGEMPVVVYMTREGYLKAHPDALQRFTNAIYKALLWLQNHDAAQICQLIDQYSPSPDKETVKRCIEKIKALNIWAKTPVIARESYAHFLELFLDAKEIPEPVPYAQMVNNHFSAKAVQNITLQANE